MHNGIVCRGCGEDGRGHGWKGHGAPPARRRTVYSIQISAAGSTGIPARPPLPHCPVPGYHHKLKKCLLSAKVRGDFPPWSCSAPRCLPFPVSPAERTRRRRARRGRQGAAASHGARRRRVGRSASAHGDGHRDARADEEVVAGFKVAGRVSEIAVDLGSPVRKGQVLARLDPTDFRLRVEQAEAALRQVRAGLGLPRDGAAESVDPEKTALVREARAVLEEARLSRDRTARLSEKNLIARSEVDASQSRLLVAESRYQAALEEIPEPPGAACRAELGPCPCPAAAGRRRAERADRRAVRERRASVGEYLAAGAPVFGLVRTHPLRLRVAVPERDAPLRPGRAVGPGSCSRGTPRRTPAAWPA